LEVVRLCALRVTLIEPATTPSQQLARRCTVRAKVISHIAMRLVMDFTSARLPLPGWLDLVSGTSRKGRKVLECRELFLLRFALTRG
jgi:hypothetical protein